MRLFLNGTAMSGQADHDVIAGATFLSDAWTAPRYRFVAVRDQFPGLVPVAAGGGPVVGELYEVTAGMLFGSLLPTEPPELELGTIELADGEVVNAMLLRPERVSAGDKLVDITDLRGWRTYQAFLQANNPGALARLLASDGRRPAGGKGARPAAGPGTGLRPVPGVGPGAGAAVESGAGPGAGAAVESGAGAGAEPP